MRLTVIIVPLLAAGIIALAPDTGVADETDNRRLRDLIENQAGYGELGGPGNAIVYAVERLSEDGCDIVVKETNTIVQRSTNEKLANRYNFSLADLNPKFQWVPGGGKFLVLFYALKDKKLGFEGLDRTVPEQEMKYRSTSVGFHFEDEDAARDFARLARKLIMSCQ